MASQMLLLPQPFGPTMAVMPEWKEMETRSANDLKPKRSRRWSFTLLLPESQRGGAALQGRVERAGEELGFLTRLIRAGVQPRRAIAGDVDGDPLARERLPFRTGSLAGRIGAEIEGPWRGTHHPFLDDLVLLEPFERAARGRRIGERADVDALPLSLSG